MSSRICHPVRVRCGEGEQGGMMQGPSKTNGAARLNRPVNEHESMNVKYDRGFASVAGQG
jgi:hypothetical protein